MAGTEEGEGKKGFDSDAISAHFRVLGDRKNYCLLGGKYEWNVEKKKYEIPKGKVFTEWVLCDKVIEFIKQKNNNREQVWISLNDKEIGDDSNKGVLRVCAIWFDIDAPRKDKNKTATEEEKKIAFENAKSLEAWLFNEFGVRGFIACSGNGYHLFYPIEPYDLMVDVQKEEFNDKQRGFLKKISKESGIGIDTTTDIRRVTQAIGSLNLKIPDNPLQTYWIGKQSKEVVEKNISEARKSNIVLLKGILGTKLEQQLKQDISGEQHQEFEKLLENDAKLKSLYEGNWQKYDFKSRSEAEQSLVTILCMNEFSDDKIKEIMKGCKIGKWQEKEDSYHNATIKKGREFAAQHPKPRERVKSDIPDVFYRDDTGHRKINFEVLVDNLRTEYVFKTLEDSEELLVYDNGVYRNGITFVKAYLESVLGSAASKRIVGEIIAHIQRGTYTQRDLFNRNSECIPLENGLLKLETFELARFDPEMLYTFRLPVEYNENAGYAHIVEFFNDVLHPEDIATMQELFGYVLYAGYPSHKAMWWIGAGRNGKTTAGNLLAALVGAENTAGVPLKQLDGGHRFAVARLFGKLLNIVAEPETKAAMQTPTFKAATGGDTIFGEWKNVQDAFPFVNFAKFVIYANRVPKIEDSTFAFWERVIAIEFPHTFTKKEAKKDYSKTLIEQDGLSGLLKWALEGLKRLRENNWEFTETETQKQARGNMRRQAQPVKTFIDEWTEFDNEGDIPKPRLFEAFRMYCDVYGLLVPDEGDFTRELKRNAKVELKRLQMEEWDISGRVLSWRGLKLNNNVDVVFTDTETEEEANGKITGENERNIKIKVSTLPIYMMCQTCQACHTFFYATEHIGEKTVIMENREQLPLYTQRVENTPNKCDTYDIPKKGELEQPPTSLPNIIKSIVIAATEEDERGAMELALINHVAKQFQFSADEVKSEIEKMLRDGELTNPSQDFIKVVDTGGSEQ